MFPKAYLAQTQKTSGNPAMPEPQLADEHTPTMTCTVFVWDILATDLFVSLPDLCPIRMVPNCRGEASSVSRRCVADEAPT